jgi:hypothetical protein
MENRLTLRPIMHAGEDAELSTRNPTIFEVIGFPSGEEAVIRRVDNRWKIIRVRNGVRTSWSEGYESAEDALAVLQNHY